MVFHIRDCKTRVTDPTRLACKAGSLLRRRCAAWDRNGCRGPGLGLRRCAAAWCVVSQSEVVFPSAVLSIGPDGGKRDERHKSAGKLHRRGAGKKRYSALQMKTPAFNGLRPPTSLDGLYAFSGTPKLEADEAWVRQVIPDHTDWGLVSVLFFKSRELLGREVTTNRRQVR